ncbi:ABC transporter ATP-binding protein [Limoniibacter endophyticus]|uniref:Sugar ABC transporter ATP-binding protein n=1 Tax=Limoniibacter endophyticus TaxID=1565040 RepID=A0A8J3GHU1_9HYPH|nr:ATP-binding cassette domain-containing protein [Limoniibacter endophyticus]GHC73034.1 sugar ABC transporter ATP-binding protein [Limoniibacter endophyticus]
MKGIILRDIRKSYGRGSQILHGIDMTIEPGEFIVIVGPSGCGKSTLLRLIAGLETCTEGEIIIDGRRANDLPPQDRDIAMIFQNYALYPHMTVRENIAFGLELRGMPRRERHERAEAVARTLQLDPYLDRKPGALSGGQRQRVAMGRAMARNTSTFLMDEPLSNLDNALRVAMRTEIKQLHRQLGATIIYVTHDQTEALSLADRVAVFKDGKLLQFDTPEAIYDRPSNQFVAGFLGAPAMNFVAGDHLEGLMQGRDIIAGFRPEALSAHREQPAEFSWPARALLSEMTGADAILHCETPVGRLSLSIARKDLPSDPDNFWVGYAPEDALLFDAHTGNAIWPGQ